MENITFLHARFCDYSFTFKGNSPRTIKALRDNIRSYLVRTRHEELAQMSRQSIEDWIIWGKAERGWCAKTIRNQLQGMSLFLEWCFQHEYIADNPYKIP